MHYLLYTADDTVPSPLPPELLPYVRSANVVHIQEANLESAVEGSSMRAQELYGYSETDWARKRLAVACRMPLSHAHPHYTSTLQPCASTLRIL